MDNPIPIDRLGDTGSAAPRPDADLAGACRSYQTEQGGEMDGIQWIPKEAISVRLATLADSVSLSGFGMCN